ncbi:MAG: sugar-transfer associated ATP-grasp domain-containing protein [Roseobacter sp.]|jgi:hypothetical protein|nr:sugar-transfer associated ATP-grasp domain-containing protein [Roseobacter sp.]
MVNIAVEGRQKTALLEGSGQGHAPEAPMIVRVARAYNVSPFRQMRETLSLRFGAQKLRPKDYYKYGLYDPAMPMPEKKQYVGNTGNATLNARLSPPELIPTAAFVGNKALYTALLKQMGLGTTDTQAVVMARGTLGAWPVLRDAAALKSFLMQDAAYPIFGKPRHGSLSEGSVRIDGCKDGKVLLGNGESYDINAFCAEVLTKYAGGFLLQSALVPHAQMAAVTGQSIGCVRVVTVNDTGVPRALYAVWKIPSPQAMSDNFWQEGSMLAAVDLETGQVTGCVKGEGIDTVEITHHPETGEVIIGQCLPHWQAVKALATDAHALFPEFGVCGYDIAICDDGPKIIECNDNPFHTLYQIAHRRGALNSNFAPIWDAVAKRQKERLARQKKTAGKKHRTTA